MYRIYPSHDGLLHRFVVRTNRSPSTYTALQEHTCAFRQYPVALLCAYTHGTQICSRTRYSAISNRLTMLPSERNKWGERSLRSQPWVSAQDRTCSCTRILRPTRVAGRRSTAVAKLFSVVSRNGFHFVFFVVPPHRKNITFIFGLLLTSVLLQ